jgi:hypothetical protein
MPVVDSSQFASHQSSSSSREDRYKNAYIERKKERKCTPGINDACTGSHQRFSFL